MGEKNNIPKNFTNRKSINEESENTGVTCPNCGFVFDISELETDENNKVSCPKCGYPIFLGTPESQEDDGCNVEEDNEVSPEEDDTEYNEEDETEYNEEDDSEYNEEDDAEYNEEDDPEYNEEDDPEYNEEDDTEYNEEDDTEYNEEDEAEYNEEDDTEYNEEDDPEYNEEDDEYDYTLDNYSDEYDEDILDYEDDIDDVMYFSDLDLFFNFLNDIFDDDESQFESLGTNYLNNKMGKNWAKNWGSDDISDGLNGSSPKKLDTKQYKCSNTNCNFKGYIYDLVNSDGVYICPECGNVFKGISVTKNENKVITKLYKRLKKYESAAKINKMMSSNIKKKCTNYEQIKNSLKASYFSKLERIKAPDKIYALLDQGKFEKVDKYLSTHKRR